MDRRQRTERDPPKTATTLDELVLHLREAGAKRVYLSKDTAFQDGVISIITTVEQQRGEEHEREDVESETLTNIIDYYSGDDENASDGTPDREHVTNVFETIGDRVRFASTEWTIDWTVRSEYSDPPLNLATLYDRGIEYKLGDGFNLRNVLFVYEQHCECDPSLSEHRAATRSTDPSGTYW